MSDVSKFNLLGEIINIKDSEARNSVEVIQNTIGSWSGDSIADVVNAINISVGNITDDIDTIEGTIGTMEDNIGDNADDITELNGRVSNLTTRTGTIEDTLDDIGVINVSQLNCLREYLASENTLNVCCIGDSLTRGANPSDTSTVVTNTYPSVLNTYLNVYGSASVTNLGVNGNTSEDVLGRIASVPSSTDICCVMVGTNDISKDVAVSDYATNVIGIVTALKNRNITPVLISPPPLLRPDEKRRAKHCVYNQILRLIANAHSVVYVPCYEILSEFINDGSLTTAIIADGTHYTDYTRIAGAVFETILSGCVTILDEGFNELIRNKGVITTAGLVEQGNANLASSGNLQLTEDSDYTVLLKVPRKMRVWLVGDGIARGGNLDFTLNGTAYSVGTNIGSSTSTSQCGFITQLNGGYYLMRKTGVSQGASTSTSDFSFYLNGIYCVNYCTGNKTLTTTIGVLPVVTRTYSVETTITAGGTPNVDVPITALNGYLIAVVVCDYISSSGICASYAQLYNSTTARVKVYSARSSDVTCTVRVKVVYIRSE